VNIDDLRVLLPELPFVTRLFLNLGIKTVSWHFELDVRKIFKIAIEPAKSILILIYHNYQIQNL